MRQEHTRVLVAASRSDARLGTPVPVRESATLGKMAGRSLSPDETERLCKALRERRAAGETQEQLATRIGVSQQTISRALRGEGAGFDLARRFAAAYGMPVDVVLSGRPGGTRPTLDRIPDYAEVEAAARARAPYLPDAAWAKVRAMSGADVADLTPELLVGFATTWAQAIAGRLREMPDDGDRPPPVKPGRR